MQEHYIYRIAFETGHCYIGVRTSPIGLTAEQDSDYVGLPGRAIQHYWHDYAYSKHILLKCETRKIANVQEHALIKLAKLKYGDLCINATRLHEPAPISMSGLATHHLADMLGVDQDCVLRHRMMLAKLNCKQIGIKQNGTWLFNPAECKAICEHIRISHDMPIKIPVGQKGIEICEAMLMLYSKALGQLIGEEVALQFEQAFMSKIEASIIIKVLDKFESCKQELFAKARKLGVSC